LRDGGELVDRARYADGLAVHYCGPSLAHHVLGLLPHQARQPVGGVAGTHHVVELGVCEAGAQRGDVDAVALEFHVEGLRYVQRSEVFAADLTDPTAPAAITERATELGLHIDVLINNAGLASSTTFSEAPRESVAAEIQLMVTALTELTHLVIPGMKERGWGRIVNLS
jgi:NAD(P)-dependent dehydrogenase (short-subunit alcohol dehydrogenase family)